MRKHVPCVIPIACVMRQAPRWPLAQGLWQCKGGLVKSVRGRDSLYKLSRLLADSVGTALIESLISMPGFEATDQRETRKKATAFRVHSNAAPWTRQFISIYVSDSIITVESCVCVVFFVLLYYLITLNLSLLFGNSFFLGGGGEKNERGCHDYYCQEKKREDFLSSLVRFLMLHRDLSASARQKKRVRTMSL